MKRKKSRTPKSKKKRIDLDMEQLEQLVQRVEAGTLQEGDAALIKAMIENLVLLSQSVDEKAVTIKKMLRRLFGASTEKKDNVITSKDDESKGKGAGEDEDAQKSKGGYQKKKKKAKGHGRNGQKDYQRADRIGVKHPELTANSPCPECKEGKLYALTEPGVEIRIKGVAPLQATVYELEKLRCNLCQKIFTAPMPAEAGSKKYDASAAVMIGLLKYGSGMPFNRLAGFQGNLGIPLPSSTQWDVINGHTKYFDPIFDQFIRSAAQGGVLHNDDTDSKILSLIKENKLENPKRKGIFTTGLVSLFQENKIVLFLTGREHAGENMAKVLDHREDGKDPPIQMCDAASRNISPAHLTILALCLVHARRNFVDAALSFPEVCSFVIEALAKVYHFDALAKKQRMDGYQRLCYHQEHSGPVMETLHTWLHKQLADKIVEPNSDTGRAVKYMINHWEGLTAFMRVPNAPLDNNICERALKKAILNRKNSLFFRTENGAHTGDVYMSLIYTCELAGVNSFEYLTALIVNHEQVKIAPTSWMPWNYTSSLPT
ncbi:MAG: IS66 family transposase [Desulfobulbaceae bacterium]|nr:IS66 family transposase [Desulfobulbaceae bacterium]